MRCLTLSVVVVEVNGYTIKAGADLNGAYLRQTDLSRVDLRRATANPGTIWPDGFDPEAAGVYEISSGEDLTRINLSGVDLSGAVADENTIWSIWLGGEQGFDLEANRLAAAWYRRAGVIFR